MAAVPTYFRNIIIIWRQSGIRSEFTNITFNWLSFIFIPDRPNGTRSRRDAQRDVSDVSHSYGSSVRSIDHPKPLIRIDGVRVESSDKGVDYTDDNIPEFYALTKATLRLFGTGFSESMMITFTEESNTRGGACEGSSSGKYSLRKDGLRDHTALVDIVVPIASKTPYFICVKNKDPPMTEMVGGSSTRV